MPFSTRSVSVDDGKYDDVIESLMGEIDDNPGVLFDALFGYFLRNRLKVFTTLHNDIDKSYNKWQGVLQGELLRKDASMEDISSSSSQNSMKFQTTFFASLSHACSTNTKCRNSLVKKLKSDSHLIVSEDVTVSNSVSKDSISASQMHSNASNAESSGQTKGHSSAPHSSKQKASIQFSNKSDNSRISWTQTYEDIDLRVALSKHIKKVSQVRVAITSTSLKIEEESDDSLSQQIITGSFKHPINDKSSFWTFHSGECILMMTLSKKEELIWDRLFVNDEPLDLKNVSFERDYHSLPEESKSKIQEIMFNESQKFAGKPTSDAVKMESMLKRAWDAEGSPFKGQPFDPSLVNIVTTS